MRKLAFVLLLPIGLYAQEYLGTFSLDTNIYEDPNFTCYAFIGLNGDASIINQNAVLRAYAKKGTRQLDIFTFYLTKIGSFEFPSSVDMNAIARIYLSQYFLDNDAGWECVAIFSPATTERYFIVFDESGKNILSDSLEAYPAFDGQNTYIFTQRNLNGLTPSRKVWRFRTNISSSSQPLSKTAATVPGPMMTIMPEGDLRVNLQPVSGGTSIQIFDMLGRQLFNETIQNINKPTTFNIPASGMPNSPFVAKVNNGNGSYLKKGLPVR